MNTEYELVRSEMTEEEQRRYDVLYARAQAEVYMQILIDKLMKEKPEIKSRYTCTECNDQGVLYYGNEQDYGTEPCPDCQGPK